MMTALADLGWMKSAQLRRAVTVDDEPLPWFTYPTIEWLSQRLAPTDKVFEFGAGQSTLWFAARVAHVTSVEHDDLWTKELAAIGPPNVDLVSVEDPGDGDDLPPGHPYLGPLDNIEDRFDVIVVDARARLACLRLAATRIVGDGLILLDNSDRARYTSGIAAMHEQGFGRIDFLGPVPGSGRLGMTSAFMQNSARWLQPNIPLRQHGYD